MRRNFPAQALLRLRPELREKAVVIMEGEPPLQTVCAMNGKAGRLGIAREMTKVEVETFASVTVLQRATAEEAAARAALLECAGTFSPRVEERAYGNAFLCVVDTAGTEKLFGPAAVLAQALLRRVRALSVIASAAVSSNFEAAICHARGWPTRTAVIPAGSEGAALASLPIAVLELSDEHAETFELWGIRTLGALRVPMLNRKELTLLARVGALNSLDGTEHRRDALWQVERAGKLEGPLLRQNSEWLREADETLPLERMNTAERLMADYGGTGLTVGRHPMHYQRGELLWRGVLSAEQLRRCKDGASVRAAGCVIARQRPGTAKGFIFLSMEDETGIANVIVTPDLYERERMTVVAANSYWWRECSRIRMAWCM